MLTRGGGQYYRVAQSHLETVPYLKVELSLVLVNATTQPISQVIPCRVCEPSVPCSPPGVSRHITHHHLKVSRLRTDPAGGLVSSCTKTVILCKTYNPITALGTHR